MGAQRQVTPCMWFLLELAGVPQCGLREGTSPLHPGSMRMEAMVASYQLAQRLTARQDRPMTFLYSATAEIVLESLPTGWRGLTVTCNKNTCSG